MAFHEKAGRRQVRLLAVPKVLPFLPGGGVFSERPGAVKGAFSAAAARLKWPVFVNNAARVYVQLYLPAGSPIPHDGLAYEKGARLDSNSETAACRGWVRPERDLFSFVRLVARRSSAPKLDAAPAKDIHENLGFLFTEKNARIVPSDEYKVKRAFNLSVVTVATDDLQIHFTTSRTLTWLQQNRKTSGRINQKQRRVRVSTPAYRTREQDSTEPRTYSLKTGRTNQNTIQKEGR
jgi:hypothetical protein